MIKKTRNWQVLTLSEVAQLVGGGTPSRANKNFFGGSIDWVTPTDLPPIGEVSELGRVKDTLTDEGLSKSSARLLPPGTVLYSSRASIGKVAVTNRPCSTNQGFANLIPHDGIVDSWFLAYYLCHATTDIVKLAGETTYKEVSKAKLSAFPIALPSLEEQRRIVNRIAECLSRVKEIRQLRSKSRQEAEAIFPSALSSYISESWPLKPLESIAVDIRNGWSGKADEDGAKTKVLRLSSVHSRAIDPTESKEVKLRTSVRQEFRIVKGDLFIVRGNGSKHLVGRSAIATQNYDDVIFNDLLIRVRFGSEALPRFVHYMLHSPFLRRQIEDKAKTAAGIWKVNQTHLSMLRIPCPDIPQQEELIEKIERTESVSSQLLTELSDPDVGMISQSVLRKAFAGEL